MIRTWLINWFEKNALIEKKEILQHIQDNYFEMKWIDSFKFITFISDIETKHSICFTNTDFQNREFSSLTGLEKIIKKKREEQK